MAADWELPNRDMIIWILQASRHDSAPCHTSSPRAECTPPGDPQALISTPRTDSAGDTDIGAEYATIKREFGLSPNFEALSMAAKLLFLHEQNIDPTRIAKFLDLAARRNTARASAGPLRPASSGVQSYLNFCTF